MSNGSGCVNDLVSFINLSFGGVVTNHWDFGDGNTSNLTSPTHVYSDTGTYTITLTTTDGAGLTDTWTDSYIVRPPVAQFVLNPSIGCSLPHTVFFTDQSTLPDTWFWDFGDGNTSTLQNPVHNYTSVGNYVVTLTITDTIYGCSDTKTDTVKVGSPTAAVDGGFGYFGCGPLTVNFTESSTVPFGSITNWSWDFGDGNTSTAQEPTHIYQDPGAYTVTLTVTSSTGCTSTDTNPFFVQVIGPDVNFGADTFGGCPPLTVNFTDSTFFGAPIISWSWNFGDGNTSSLQNPTHTYTTYDTMDVSLTVTDIDGCSRTLTFNNYINTLDNVNPSINCPSNISQSVDAGQCNAAVSIPLPTTNDNCSIASVINDFNNTSNASDTYPLGTTTVIWTITDGNGNTNTCSFDMTIVDDENPSMSCPGNITQNTDPSSCDAVVTYTTPVGTDNCTGATTIQIAGLASGSTFPIGTTTNTFEVTDAAGNTNTCSFDVTIVDNENPTISCPGNITQNADPGSCGAVVTYTAPVGTDNCSGATTIQTVGLASGSTFPIGTTTNTFEVTDAAGNTNTCSFDVTVVDNENPTIVCPGNITQNTDPGSCDAVVTFTTPVGTDNCTGANTAQIAGLTSGSAFPIGTTTNTFEVTDAAGNTSSCSFDITITDNENPTISCPGNITQNTDPGSCDAAVTYTAPVGTDNCSGATTVQIAGLTSGSAFPIGTTTNTFEVTDAAGNIATCSFDVIVTDNENPVITCPANIQTCDSVITFNDPVITDNCTGATFVLTSGLSGNSIFPVGITTNTYTVTDASGNTATCSFDIERYALPVINAGNDLTTDAGKPIQIDATGSNIASYDWSPAIGLDDPMIEDPLASPEFTTSYTITVTSSDGCMASDDITVSIKLKIEVNNFMSPNGDGKNDTWIIKGHYLLDDCTIQVFDSWGNVIFERTGYDNMWDGTHNGNQLPEGNYYYTITCGSDEPITGSITLIR